jgi:hypothetical protein
MDKDKVKEKFIKLFKSFINDLCISFPEYSEILSEHYKDILESEGNIDDNDKLNNFLEIIYINNTKITKRDKEFFNQDPKLLHGVSLKQLWNKEIKPKNRNIIWKYFQSFCVISINLKSSDELQKLLNGKQESIKDDESISKKDLKQLKKMNMLNKSLKESNEEKLNNNPLEGLDMLTGSSIGKLAQDIASNINLEKTGLDKINTDGEVDIANIFQSVNFGELFSTINEQVKSKFDNGELNESILSKDAENILPNMMNNPFFKQMMDQNIMGNQNVDKN